MTRGTAVQLSVGGPARISEELAGGTAEGISPGGEPKDCEPGNDIGHTGTETVPRSKYGARRRIHPDARRVSFEPARSNHNIGTALDPTHQIGMKWGPWVKSACMRMAQSRLGRSVRSTHLAQQLLHAIG